jgi:Ni/Co efflux regulator RcnB
VTAASDPTQSEAYLALQEELSTAQEQVSASEAEAQRAAADKRRVETAAAQRDSELDQRERNVAAREQAASAVEQQIAANSIGQGTWTVGRDIEPGTYRTREAVVGDCYWAILASGTNGGDIIENDIPSGGFPTVTLSAGQDFENNGCGTFVKQ